VKVLRGVDDQFLHQGAASAGSTGW
jgi:hypothetical protein